MGKLYARFKLYARRRWIHRRKRGRTGRGFTGNTKQAKLIFRLFLDSGDIVVCLVVFAMII